MVAQVKRLSGERRVGHAGTLDPIASGVLPICLGRATRLVEFLMETAKSYRAQIELGTATDTYDATGTVIQQGDTAGIGREQLEAALVPFLGIVAQYPPMYSAVKHRGQPLYRLARAGINVERQSRPVSIYRLEVLHWQPPLVTVEIDCGRGTYIRALAHDLGQRLGCGAHLKELVRLRYGPFDTGSAVSPDQLEEAFAGGNWQRLLYPMDIVLQHWPAVVLSQADEALISNGGAVSLAGGESPAADGGRCRAYTEDGRFAAVMRFDAGKGEWRPEKVFLEPASG